MLFRRASVRYGRTPEPETPYQKAAQVWDERIGSARVQARNWRLIAFGNLLLAAGLAGGMIWQVRWTAILTIVLDTPHDADRLRKNPLGVFVHAINWSKELG
jgi:type IV secretory pathway TrbF-like protein